MQFLDALDNFRDVERLARASEYVMHHANLGLTFPDYYFRLARTAAQTLHGLELGFKRSFKSAQYCGFDLIFFHGSILL